MLRKRDDELNAIEVDELTLADVMTSDILPDGGVQDYAVTVQFFRTVSCCRIEASHCSQGNHQQPFTPNCLCRWFSY